LSESLKTEQDSALEADKIKKARRHVSQNEGLIFEKSAPGKRGIEFPPLDVPAVDAARELGKENIRAEVEGFPEVSEIEVVRHFTRLSTWNYAIDLGMYPLGSCTMKYNPASMNSSRALTVSPPSIRTNPSSCRKAACES